jgi:hypothetical protein
MTFCFSRVPARQARPQRAWVAVLLLAVGASACAQLASVSAQQFRDNTQRLEQLVESCAANAKACNPDAVGPDQKVAAEGSRPGFTIRWDWLRDALHQAQDPARTREGDRTYDPPAAMRDARGHLQELAAQAGGAPAPNPDAAKAAAIAHEVLARPEFAPAPPPTWLERHWNRMLQWIGSLFDGVGALGQAWPWLGTTLEWLLFLSAAVGLLLFARRAFLRQRLAVSIGAGAGRLEAWDRDATDWAALAEACATGRQWREAVHCLYWAGIVRLESRRSWRHNPARTPREYVRLLKPGSPQQGALRSLTHIFERVWYGLRDASPEDYQRARRLFDGLSQTSAGQPNASTTEPA